MVFHIGFAPGHGTAYFENTSINEVSSDIKIDKVYYYEMNKVKQLFINLKCQFLKMAGKNPTQEILGNAVVFLAKYDYGSEIRKKFIEAGKNVGFKKVEILDYVSGLFIYSMAICGKQLPENSVVWIVDNDNIYVWQKSKSSKTSLIKAYRESWYTEELIQKIQDETGLGLPDLIIFSSPVKDYVKFFFTLYQTFYFKEQFDFAKAAFIKSKINAGDAKFVHFDAENVLNRKISLKIGESKILCLKELTTKLPYEKILKVKKPKDAVVLKIKDFEKITEIPMSDSKWSSIIFQIDKNGVFESKVQNYNIIRFTDKEIFVYNVVSQKSLSFPSAVDFGNSKLAILIILEKAIKKSAIFGNMATFVLAVPSSLTNEHRKVFVEAAESIGHEDIKTMDEELALLLMDKKFLEVRI